MANVDLKNVTKNYRPDNCAVDNLSISIKDGEFIVIVGPSGCGKSTTLRMIAGLEEISSGSIFIGEKKVNDILPRDRNIAMVFQNYALYPHMTVFENLSYGLKLRRTSKEEIKTRVDEVSEILGLSKMLGRKPRALSGGERQRVALGRAIVREPEVFLFDEPLSNLDARLRVKMRSEITKLHRKLGTTMVYVTHDQTEAMTMGDRIAVMNNGKLQQVDTPQNLYDHPANIFVAGFIGSPSMNFVEGSVDLKKGELEFSSPFFSFLIPERFKSVMSSYEKKKIVVGFRPEHVSLTNGKEITGNGKITAVEPMGPEVVLYLEPEKEDDTVFLARIFARDVPQPGTTTGFSIDYEKCHFFDPETGNLI